MKGLYLGSGCGEVKQGRKGASKVCVGKHMPQNDPTQEARELGYLSTTVSGAKALIHRNNTRDRWKLLGHNEMCKGCNRTWTALAAKSNDAI